MPVGPRRAPRRCAARPCPTARAGRARHRSGGPRPATLNGPTRARTTVPFVDRSVTEQSVLAQVQPDVVPADHLSRRSPVGSADHEAVRLVRRPPHDDQGRPARTTNRSRAARRRSAPASRDGGRAPALISGSSWRGHIGTAGLHPRHGLGDARAGRRRSGSPAADTARSGRAVPPRGLRGCAGRRVPADDPGPALARSQLQHPLRLRRAATGSAARGRESRRW